MNANVEAPAWLEDALQDIKPEEVQLWSCHGDDIEPPKRKWWQLPLSRRRPTSGAFWRLLYATKEEAEAHAACPSETWTWDREPAAPEQLTDAMSNARRKGDLGVAIIAYRNGEWITVKEFPADVPLGGC